MTTKKARKVIIDIAKKYNTIISCHYFNPDVELAKKQNKSRDRQVPEHVIDSQAAKWVEPSLEEGFHFYRQNQ